MCASLGLRWPLPCSNLCLIGLGWAGGGRRGGGKHCCSFLGAGASVPPPSQISNEQNFLLPDIVQTG